jgi:hypothetical protein
MINTQRNTNRVKLSKKFVSRKTYRSSNLKSTEEVYKKNDIENWLSCDMCNKWRKLPSSKLLFIR